MKAFEGSSLAQQCGTTYTFLFLKSDTSPLSRVTCVCLDAYQHLS